ncbi:MAG: thiO, partial [Proteobacteria bacterium]|nr:thiO [Pseudomonadota bacterium]
MSGDEGNAMSQAEAGHPTPDALIIGGGVIGLMTARELAKAGARVTLLERQSIGRESSWAGGGILSPLYPWRAPTPVTALSRWSQRAYPGLIEELKADTGIDPEWMPSGLLITECDDAEEASHWCLAHDVKLTKMDADALRRIEPRLGISAARPFCLPEIAQVRNPRLLKALRDDLIRRRVRLLENHEVIGIEQQQGLVRAILTNKERFTAKNYVIACGAWSRQVGDGLATHLEVEPVKGQMLVFAAAPGLIRHIILHDGRYLIPRTDGKVLVGSTVEYTGFDKTTSEDARGSLVDFALSVLPELSSYPIEKHWAGLRPGSPEGIPVIGAHP